MSEPMVTIPVGYLCISFEEYNDLHNRLTSAKLDFHDELARANRYAHELELQLGHRDEDVRRLEQDMKTIKEADDNLRMELLHKMETIETLRAEIRLLNEELCKTDEFMEISPHAKTED